MPQQLTDEEKAARLKQRALSLEYRGQKARLDWYLKWMPDLVPTRWKHARSMAGAREPPPMPSKPKYVKRKGASSECENEDDAEPEQATPDKT